MHLRLDGKTALVTGAGRNLGRAMAIALAEAGANVVVNARSNRAEAAAVAREVERAGTKALVVLGDVGDHMTAERIVAAGIERFGAIDILVNNAAIRPRQAFTDITPGDWDRVLRTNLSSAFYCSRAAVPRMAERKFGRIVNISSMEGAKGAANRAHSVASKAGLVGFTKALAIELGHSGITVNALVPGVFDTTRPKDDYPTWPPPQSWLDQLPVPRLGHPNEVAAACLYLASDAASYITGQSFHINGGMYM